MHAKQMSHLKSKKFKIYFLAVLTNLEIIQVSTITMKISGVNRGQYPFVSSNRSGIFGKQPIMFINTNHEIVIAAEYLVDS